MIKKPSEDLLNPLELSLDSFEGPLDFLLYLVKRKNIDIFNLPIKEIIEQYAAYIDKYQDNYENISNYLEMLAELLLIKSKLLLPKQKNEANEDPREELVKKLFDLNLLKELAKKLEKLPRVEKDFFIANVEPNFEKVSIKTEKITLKDIVSAYEDICKKEKLFSNLQVSTEKISVNDKKIEISNKLCLKYGEKLDFDSLYTREEGNTGKVAAFLAVLDLVKDNFCELEKRNNKLFLFF